MKHRQIMIYVHIPFCIQKCRYCDFLSFPGMGTDVMEDYYRALEEELKTRKYEAEHKKVSSVFIGGGTPSILPKGMICRLMNTIRENYDILPEAEITMEVNPGTVTEEKAEDWKKAGINRISMGVQSFDDEILRVLGRIHDVQAVESSFDTLWQQGFRNISFDLMMGLPGQNMENLEETLRKAVSFPIRHLSLYSLIVEEGTVFYDLSEKGQLPLPEEEKERQMYHHAVDFLREHGFLQYEISNFAVPGFESVHNTGYWQRKEYIGAGLGASSLIEETRFHDTADLSSYMDHPVMREEVEILSSRDQMSETVFLGLRQNAGIRLTDFEETFGMSIDDAFPGVIAKHIKNGLIEIQDGRLCLTSLGMDLSNQVFVDFI
ncbi:MAG: radical SAM family heme chaperone HemW [Firmicutes bacterium]|nr:radical SAM family heme chaperone HemW [Bacillota bacterium]